jgi:Fe-S-cluster containining protein
MTDKDRPSSWVSYSPGLCANCVAACCTMPLEVRLSDLIRLGLVEEGEASPKKIARRLSKIVKSYRAASGLFLLQQKADESCPFLGEDRLCTVYEKRPDVCRGFPSTLGPRVSYCPYRKKPERRRGT